MTQPVAAAAAVSSRSRLFLDMIIHQLAININDVKCGRGGYSTTSQGNIRFERMGTDLVRQNIPRLQANQTATIRLLAEQLFNWVNDSSPPGRFLWKHNKDPTLWATKSDGDAIERCVGYLYRTYRDSKNKPSPLPIVVNPRIPPLYHLMYNPAVLQLPFPRGFPTISESKLETVYYDVHPSLVRRLCQMSSAAWASSTCHNSLHMTDLAKTTIFHITLIHI